MSIFKKNQNETAFVEGKKHWTDVIKNSGDGELLIWRQPEEDFNTNSTLIVMPGEQAIFVKSGTIEHVFDNGTYKLTTENYPFLSRLKTAFSGGISTFNCVIYFVRKAHSFEIKWGTDSPIQVRDKLLGIATKVKARGIYKVQISNPSVFLEKLIGSNTFLQTQEELDKYFAYEFQGKIKATLTQRLNALESELLGVEARLEEFSLEITPYIEELLSGYGLRCVNFTIAAMDIDDNDLRQKYDEIGIGAIEKMRMAQADKAVLDTLGEGWAKMQAADILKDLANNPGSGGIAATGAGLGMGFAAGNVFGNMAQQMFAPMNGNNEINRPAAPQPSGRFVQKSTGRSMPTQEDPVMKIKQLKEMLDIGAISQEEFDKKKQEILDRM